MVGKFLLLVDYSFWYVDKWHKKKSDSILSDYIFTDETGIIIKNVNEVLDEVANTVFKILTVLIFI